MQTQSTFFGEHLALAALNQAGDPLVTLDQQIDLAPLVAVADRVWRNPQKAGTGRPPWPSAIMFRALLLKRLYNISDDQLEYQLRDRLSFMRFVGLEFGGAVPDSRTLWEYGEALAQADTARKLFETFTQQLEQRGLILHEGKLLDATFVPVPIQRNSRKDNALIKQGKTPAAWQDAPAKLRQKDMDARWAKKGNESFYGYKNHVKVDTATKYVVDYVVTTASVHDSQCATRLIGAAERGEKLHADSAYAGAEIGAHLATHGVISRIHAKGCKSSSLTPGQKRSNKAKSRIRARVEHTFAFMEGAMGGIYQRAIGLKRNAHGIGMMNLIYNLWRAIQLGHTTGTTMATA